MEEGTKKRFVLVQKYFKIMHIRGSCIYVLPIVKIPSRPKSKHKLLQLESEF